jgi:hypothetical protein
VVAAIAFSTAPAFAADMVTKGKSAAAAPPPPPPAWDIAFGGAIASDYVWRGITQSNHKPSVAAYFEPRYNINKDLQLYAGIGGASILPEPRRAEVDTAASDRPSTSSRSISAFGIIGIRAGRSTMVLQRRQRWQTATS